MFIFIGKLSEIQMIEQLNSLQEKRAIAAVQNRR